MDQYLISRLNEQFIPCPHYWVRPLLPLPNEVLPENFKRLFSPYLPPIQGNQLTVNYISPLNNYKKPYCQWQVHFSHILPMEGGLYGKLRKHLNENKPRNTSIKLTVELGDQNFIATYTLICECKIYHFFIPDETNLLYNSVKLEESFSNCKFKVEYS